MNTSLSLVEMLRNDYINGHVSMDRSMLAINQLLRLHDENAEMRELLRLHGIKYPKQQPVLFTKMVDFEPR